MQAIIRQSGGGWSRTLAWICLAAGIVATPVNAQTTPPPADATAATERITVADDTAVAAPEAPAQMASKPSKPNPLARLPVIGRFFGDPDVTDGLDGGKVSPRYALRIEAPDPIARLIRQHTLLGRWRQRADYDPSQLPLFIARAEREVRDLLASEGYFSPQVAVSTLDDGALVQVLTGPRTVVDRVQLDLEGEIATPQREALRQSIERSWQLPAGEPFRSQDWEQAKRALLDALRDRGYLRARLLESEAEVNQELARASLELVVDSGSAVQFGPLVIEGLNRYPPEIIEGLKPFRTGDPYDTRQIADLQTRLNGAGWFTTVNVRPDVRALSDAADLQEVPIKVEVIERPSKRWTLGAGYDADYGPSLLAGWESRNVAGLGIQTFNGIELDQRRQFGFSTWESPQDLQGYRWQGGLRLEHRNIENDIVDAASLFAARLRREGKIETGLSLQYQYERQNVVFSSDNEAFYRNRALVLGWSWTRRDLDSPLMPTRGTITTVQISGASNALGSERSFVRGYVLGYGIYPLSRAESGEFGRLVLRGELGAVYADSREGIPSANLFRTGGSKSVRGYVSQSLGVSLGEAVVAGRYLAVASAEYQHLIGRDWAIAGFVDAGNASDSIDTFKLARGAGIGVRWRTPVGPLNIDVARGFDPGQWRMYFSIGVVF